MSAQLSTQDGVVNGGARKAEIKSHFPVIAAPASAPPAAATGAHQGVEVIRCEALIKCKPKHTHTVGGGGGERNAHSRPD